MSKIKLLNFYLDGFSQCTMDNLDINNDHMTLEFIEIEQISTKHLKTDNLEFDKESFQIFGFLKLH